MNKHTPGPWVWWTSNSYRRLKNSDDKIVAYGYVCSDGACDISISESDMALIAAAPDLYEAAVKALNFITSTEGEFGITLDSGVMLRAALKKAQGTT